MSMKNRTDIEQRIERLEQIIRELKRPGKGEAHAALAAMVGQQRDALAWAAGTRRGRYHNETFRRLATDCGVSYDPREAH